MCVAGVWYQNSILRLRCRLLKSHNHVVMRFSESDKQAISNTQKFIFSCLLVLVFVLCPVSDFSESSYAFRCQRLKILFSFCDPLCEFVLTSDKLLINGKNTDDPSLLSDLIVEPSPITGDYIVCIISAVSFY